MVMLRDPKDLTLLDHLKWAYHEPSIDKLIQQLRNDMLSLQLMLAILQWYACRCLVFNLHGFGKCTSLSSHTDRKRITTHLLPHSNKDYLQ